MQKKSTRTLPLFIFGLLFAVPLIASAATPAFGAGCKASQDVAFMVQQFKALQSKGLTLCRAQINLADDTDPYVVPMLKMMIAEGAKYGVQIRPILFVPFSWGSNVTDGGKYPASTGLYQQGYDRVHKFVLNFKDQITDWEFENELNLLAGVNYGNGWTAAEFNSPLMNQWASVLKGMSDAIGAINATYGLQLRRTIGTTSTMFGFLDFMQSQGVNFDVVGYHYYEPLGTDPNNIWGGSRPPYNLFQKLASYGKPVVFNEINCAEIYNAAYENTAGQPLTEKCFKTENAILNYLTTQTYANIQEIQLYELFDEPQKATPENHFGIFYDANTPKISAYIAAAYAGGTLTAAEQAELTSRGFSVGKSVLPVTVPVPTVTIAASPTSVSSGGASTLTWSSTNATSCTASGGWSGSKSTNGSQSVTVAATAIYTLTCTGSGGSATNSVNISATTPPPPPPPAVTVSPSGATATPGVGTLVDSSLNSWTVSPAGVVMKNGVAAGFTTQVVLMLWYNNAIYQKNAPGGWWMWLGSTWSAQLPGDPRTTVTPPSPPPPVVPPPPPQVVGAPVIAISANPSYVGAGQSSTLIWSATNASSCALSGGIIVNGLGPSGTQLVTPSVSGAAYIITCTGAGGSANATAIVLSTGSGATKISANDRVQVSSGPLNVRATANTAGTLLGTQATGAFGTVISGPIAQGGFNWWNVNYDTGVDGWSVENYLTKAVATTDTNSPSTPSGLTAVAISPSQINLTWQASTDNVAVTGYKIFRNGVQIGTSAGTTYSDSSLTASNVYGYTVSAYDAAGNNSGQSSSASTITTNSAASITVGGRVVTTGNLNIRQNASPSAPKLGTAPIGTIGTVVSGPTTADNYTWWQINYSNGVSGWSIATYLAPLAPATPVYGTTNPSETASPYAQIQNMIKQIVQIQAMLAAAAASN